MLTFGVFESLAEKPIHFTLISQFITVFGAEGTV